MNLFYTIGKYVIAFFARTGSLIITFVKIVKYFPSAVKKRKLVLEQMSLIGVESLPLVLLIGSFTGAIAASQATTLFAKFNLLDIAKPFLGGSISTVIFQELTPVLTALVIAGRVGGAMAAQIGTMVVTEQVDAMEMMSIDKYRFLGMPRVFAAVLMMPLLALFSSIIALFGAFAIVAVKFAITAAYYSTSIFNYFAITELIVCLVKSALFGLITAIVGVNIGLNTSGGAEGVGNSAVQAFTLSAALILVVDALWGAIF